MKEKKNLPREGGGEGGGIVGGKQQNYSLYLLLYVFLMPLLGFSINANRSTKHFKLVAVTCCQSFTQRVGEASKNVANQKDAERHVLTTKLIEHLCIC